MSDKASWNNYWERKRLCSIGSSKGDFINKSVERYWNSIFDNLNENTEMLDIGTGNGALPYLASISAHKHNRNIFITAVDLANINPKKLFPEFSDIFECVDFIGNVNCTKLPIDSGSKDLIVAQYAIEYMPLKDTVDELYRCLKKGGQIHALIHSVEGETYIQGKDELDNLIIFQEYKFIEQACDIYDKLIEGQEPSSLLNTYNNAMYKFTGRFTNKEHLPNVFKNFFSVIGHTIAHSKSLNPHDVHSKLLELKGELNHHINRVSSLCENAVDKNEMVSYINAFKAAGFSHIILDNVWEEAQSMGIQLSAVK